MGSFAVSAGDTELAAGQFDSTARPYPFTMSIPRPDGAIDVVGTFDGNPAVFDNPDLCLQHLGNVMEAHVLSYFWGEPAATVDWQF